MLGHNAAEGLDVPGAGHGVAGVGRVAGHGGVADDHLAPLPGVLVGGDGDVRLRRVQKYLSTLFKLRLRGTASAAHLANGLNQGLFSIYLKKHRTYDS